MSHPMQNPMMEQLNELIDLKMQMRDLQQRSEDTEEFRGEHFRLTRRIYDAMEALVLLDEKRNNQLLQMCDQLIQKRLRESQRNR